MADIPTLRQITSLEGKRALITGAGAGIGLAIARRFAEAGAGLELVDIDRRSLAAAKRGLSESAAEVGVHTADLSKKEQIDDLWLSLGDQAPEILVNNAGVYPFKSLLDVDHEFYTHVMDINLNSVYWMCQNMIRARGKRGGVIVNVGSIEAILPFADNLAHYSVSKAGVIALTRSLAMEYARQGFRVNALVPGGVITQGTKSAAKQVLKLRFDLLMEGIQFSQRLPLGRPGQPDEIARMALVLASDLSTYVHGAIIPVDGGFLSA